MAVGKGERAARLRLRRGREAARRRPQKVGLARSRCRRWALLLAQPLFNAAPASADPQNRQQQQPAVLSLHLSIVGAEHNNPYHMIDSLDPLALSQVLSGLSDDLTSLASFARCSRHACEAVQGAQEAWQRVLDGMKLHDDSAGPFAKESRGGGTTRRSRRQPPGGGGGGGGGPEQPSSSSSSWAIPPACPAALEARRRVLRRRLASLERARAARARAVSGVLCRLTLARARAIAAEAERRGRAVLAQKIDALRRQVRVQQQYQQQTKRPRGPFAGVATIAEGQAMLRELEHALRASGARLRALEAAGVRLAQGGDVR
jgi:hypothetical protein